MPEGMTPEQREALSVALQAEAWRRADLRFLLDGCKRPIFEQIKQSNDTFVLETSRKVGKSWLGMALALETALRVPGARIPMACTTTKAVKEILLPIAQEILATCPEKLRPIWKESEGAWAFENGSRIVVAGAEDEAKCERLRGPSATMVVVDEAGFIPCLRYLIGSVLSHQLARTRGLMLLLSSPAVSPDHAFAKLADAAARNGRYAHRDLFSPGIAGLPDPHAYVERQAKTLGLTVEEYETTPDYQREILGLRVMDAERAAIPEWHRAKETCVLELERPEHCLTFVSIDPAYSVDAAGVLFSHFDFLGQRLVIEDELLVKRATTSELGACITSKEVALKMTPTLRVIDDSQGRLRADLHELSGLITSPAQKDHRDTAIALTRSWVGQGRVIVHPRCEKLLYQLRNALLSKSGELERDEYGHQDLIAALVYLVRAVDGQKHINPFPVPLKRYQSPPPKSALLAALGSKRGT